MGMFCRVYTDAGTVKRINQDSVGYRRITVADEEAMMVIVCDGVGGLDCGELASLDTVKTFVNWFTYEFPQVVLEGISEELIQGRLLHIISNQNEKIYEYGMEHNMKLGTTLSLLIVYAGKYYAVQLGDSRIYHIRDSVEQITEDQSLVQREINQGLITKEQGRVDSRRNILLQCLGSDVKAHPDFYYGDVQFNSVFVLCSDGFYHELEESEMFECFRSDMCATEEATDEIMRSAVEVVKTRGERDNITVSVLRMI